MLEELIKILLLIASGKSEGKLLNLKTIRSLKIPDKSNQKAMIFVHYIHEYIFLILFPYKAPHVTTGR